MKTMFKRVIITVLVAFFVLGLSNVDVKADTISNATAMTYGNKYSGSLKYGGNKYYKISVSKSGLVRYSMSSNISSLNIEVYSSNDLSKCIYKNKTEYDVSQGCYIRNNRNSHIPLMSGIYYIKISNTNLFFYNTY